MRSILWRRDVLSWGLYDWANSAWSTSISTVLLPAFFLELVGPEPVRLSIFGLSWQTGGQALWGYGNAIYMLAIAATAPLLGAIADASRGKKWFLAVTTFVGSALTMALVFIGPGQFILCAWLFIAAGYLWSAANVFYDAFLPELTDQPEQMDAISSAGYGIGYLGGGLMLALNLWMIAQPGTFGLADASAAVRVSFVLVGVWWAAFTVPLLITVCEQRGKALPQSAGQAIRRGIAQVALTLHKIRRLPQMGRFLVAFFFYNSGIGTLIIVAAPFARDTLRIDTAIIAAVILMIQFVGLPASYGFIYLARRFGPRNSVFAGLAVYTAVVVYAMQIQTVTEFWVLGFLIGLVQGGTQAISRSLFGAMIPQSMSAEFYGFFSLFNKVGPFLGPLAFALVADLTGNPRQAILFLVVFFVLGFALLLTVNPKNGIRQAREFLPEG